MYSTHIILSFSLAFQADFFNFSCTFDYEPKHIIYFYIYFSFVNEKNQQQASKQAIEWVKNKFNHWQFSIVFAKIEAIAISEVFITFMSFPSFYWTKLIRFDSIRFAEVYTKMHIYHTRGRLLMLTSTQFFSLRRSPHYDGAGFCDQKSLTCVLECLLWNWPCSWS